MRRAAEAKTAPLSGRLTFSRVSAAYTIGIEMLGYLLATAAAGLGVATGLGYCSMAPRSQLYGASFIQGDPQGRQIALTFDDGPHPRWTEQLLEVLDRHQVQATFFMIGRYASRLPQTARAVAQAGHVIGNHTFTHPNLIFATTNQVAVQIEECRRVLEETVGPHSSLFRPPHGGRLPHVLRTARRLGLVPVMWSVTGYDWRATDAAEIERNVTRRLRGGDLVLLHDGGHFANVDRSATIAATDAVIRRCRDEGHRFVTVPQMMADTQFTLTDSPSPVEKAV
jgi:peptidoglycan/xylan/chitin deacetylase (PgdA/CDA1 family)